MQATMTSASPQQPGPADNAASLRPAGAGTGANPVDLSVDSSALLQGQKTVSIHHNGALYRLQATKLGKLILTK